MVSASILNEAILNEASQNCLTLPAEWPAFT